MTDGFISRPAQDTGVPEQQVKEVLSDREYHHGRFTVKFYEPRHASLVNDVPPNPGSIDTLLIPPQPASAYKEGGSYSIVISHPRGNMLIQGSAGFTPDAGVCCSPR
jgi:hypothetical protein